MTSIVRQSPYDASGNPLDTLSYPRPFAKLLLSYSVTFNPRGNAMSAKTLDAQSMGASWKAGMKSPRAKEKYVAGIQSTNVNPMALAAGSVDLWAQRVQDSKAKFVSKLQSKNPADWKSAAVAKADRLSTGADTGLSKYTAGVAPYIPVYQQMRDTVRSMPSGTIQAAKDRANAALEVLMRAAGRQ